MNLLQRLGALLGGDRSSATRHYTYHVRCHRCGEVLTGHVDLFNDLSAEYGESAKAARYYCRKVLIGSGRCFQAIEVTLAFDADRRVTSREITGGEFVTET